MGVRAPAKDGDIVERMVILVIQHPSKLHVLAIHGMSCSESTLVPISHNLPFLHALSILTTYVNRKDLEYPLKLQT